MSFGNESPGLPGKSKKFLADMARAKRISGGSSKKNGFGNVAPQRTNNGKHDFANLQGPDTGQGNHEFTMHFSFPAVAAIKRGRQNANSYPKGDKAGGLNTGMQTGKNWPR